MKRILCTSIVLVMLLTACSTSVQQVPPTTELSGDYTYNDEEIESGHQVRLPCREGQGL